MSFIEKDLAHTNRDEMYFIDTIGDHSNVKMKRLQLLKSYQLALQKRVNFDELDAGKLMIYIETKISEIVLAKKLKKQVDKPIVSI